MKQKPLWTYVLGVIIVLTILNLYAAYRGGTYQNTVELVSLGFLLGMLAMYIAVHLYQWK